MPSNWFQELTGFPEPTWAETQSRLSVAGTQLRSLVDERTYAIGTLETPSVADLRTRARAVSHQRGSSKELPYEEPRRGSSKELPYEEPRRGSSKELPYEEPRRGSSKELPYIERNTLRVSSVVADVSALHRDPAHRHALFQGASQFNLLEMTGPHVTPEDGVTRYAHDHTQGPACASSRWWKWWRSTETGNAPRSQGATTENTELYSREEQRRDVGCRAGRMPAPLSPPAA